MLPIELFTPEEQAQIPAFKEKWRKIVLSTERVDRAQAEAAIRHLCKLHCKQPPEIIFCQSPIEAAQKLTQIVEAVSHPTFFNEIVKGENTDMPSLLAGNQIVSGIFETRALVKKANKRKKRDVLFQILLSSQAKYQKSYKELTRRAGKQIKSERLNFASTFKMLFKPEEHAFSQVAANSSSELTQSSKESWYMGLVGGILRFFLKQTLTAQALGEISDPRWTAAIERLVQLQIYSILQGRTHSINNFPSSSGALYAGIADFCDAVISAPKQPEKQNAVRAVFEQCSWLFSIEGICYICDRPTTLKLDDEYRPHAEGEAAIEYSDGTKIYAYHGINMPEQYGQTLPAQWQAQWLLTETNAEIRRALIQGIGYDRLCQDLDAIELDSWAEYTLLKVKESIDVEDLHLLKMTCPSTGHIHAMRVPPDITSARDAIKWMNWDTDPQDFSVQT
jgi:hypothetical protein